jgi:hypothetical protein
MKPFERALEPSRRAAAGEGPKVAMPAEGKKEKCQHN